MASNETEASRLQELNAVVRNQDDLERDITSKVGLPSLSALLNAHYLIGGPNPRGESRGKRYQTPGEGFE